MDIVKGFWPINQFFINVIVHLNNNIICDVYAFVQNKPCTVIEWMFCIL